MSDHGVGLTRVDRLSLAIGWLDRLLSFYPPLQKHRLARRGHAMIRYVAWAIAYLSLYTAVQAQSVDEKPVTASDRNHWAFRTPSRPPIPTVKQTGWIASPIDYFILARLESAGLKPAPPADRLSWLRRVHLDVVGLLPSPEEQESFLADSSPRAAEKVVDRLLTSPHFGERWAQHWLDTVRFAESNGYEMDGDRPHAWRYRDYVVRSFNADKPYDRFLTEQLAGDELAVGQPALAAAELWIATGLHRCGPVHLVSGNIDPEVARQEVLTEFVQGLGSAVLGLTVNCARCHDHKFDPISQADYYRLEAYFAGTRFKEVSISRPEEDKAVREANAALDAQIKPLKAQVSAIDAPYSQRLKAAKRDKLSAEARAALDVDPKKRSKEQQKLASDVEPLLKVTWEEVLGALSSEDRTRRQQIRQKIHALEAQRPVPAPTAWAVGNEEKTPATHVLKRGDVKKKLATVQPAPPRVLSSTPIPADRRTNRVELAKWLTAADHPLTSRVFVNRLWQHLFGHGLVRTPNDFGLHGEAPSHPELLDWLATELTANGWHIKPLLRSMLLSATYAQSTRGTSGQSADPSNKLLWKMPRKRMQGEMLRDAMLQASGRLNPAIGGPSVRVPLEPETYDLLFTEGEPDGLWHVTPDESQHRRRSLYLLAKRNVRLPLMEAFDQPDRLTPCADRAVSTYAPQALILMNGPIAQQESQAMASQLMRTIGNDPSKLIDRAYRLTLSRTPTDEERTDALEFLKAQSISVKQRLDTGKPVNLPSSLPANADRSLAVALADVCLALFNSNEFAYGR